VLINTTVPAARHTVLMRSAMNKAVEATRAALLAGRMKQKLSSAAPSSPTTGLITPAGEKKKA